MALVALRDVGLGFGGKLFDGVRLQIESGERICLLGRNGAGKSSLLRLIHGDLPPDHGEVVRQSGARIAVLPQAVPQDLAGQLYEVVMEGLATVAATTDAWHLPQRVEAVLSRMQLDADVRVETLSAGLKRRVLLARALVGEPDLLLLDEPTNHLDIDTIAWLEDTLARERAALLFVTHDRAFLRRLATRIVELDHGRLYDWPGDYDTYLRRKEAQLEVEARHDQKFDKKLAQEEAWIRQGIKARRTRNEGRVRALEKMRQLRRARRQRLGSARLQVQEAERSGKLVIEAEAISFRHDPSTPLIEAFSTTILRGDKVGIVGPNGAGKTTLLRLLLAELEPTAGRLRHGTQLEVAYFDQLRAQLDDEKSVHDNVAGGNELVTVGDKKRHVISYLQDFLFQPERARSPVAQLSGGERHRLLLARLFLQPSNVLVLDEPTNDLDVETLELLEGLLIDYQGTVLMVSHDRAFLNNVVTSLIAFDGDGGIGEYVGGYDDYLRQRQPTPEKERAEEPRKKPRKASASADRPAKLSYKEKTELEALPERIDELESEERQLQETLNDPAFYQRDHTEITAATERLETLTEELSTAYERWAELQEREEQARAAR